MDRRTACVTLDLGGVQFINSLGVREWVRLQTAAREAHVRLELLRVAEVLIHQLNIVPAARSASNVRSFFATYLCDHCGRGAGRADRRRGESRRRSRQ